MLEEPGEFPAGNEVFREHAGIAGTFKGTGDDRMLNFWIGKEQVGAIHFYTFITEFEGEIPRYHYYFKVISPGVYFGSRNNTSYFLDFKTF